MSFAVILDRWELPERTLVASLLSQHAGLPEPVAAKLARRAAGIVWENGSLEAAKALAAAMTATGFPARAVPQSVVAGPSTARRVHVLALEGERLGVQLKYSGPLDAVAWSDVLAISAGAFKIESKKTEVVETVVGRGVVIVDERVQVDIARDLVVELFALPLADRSQLLHIRLHSQEVNYAKCVGGTIHESWREKFCLLVAKLGLRSEAAVLSPQTEALVACGMQPQNCAVYPYFADEEEFAAHNRWLLTRKRAGGS
jgi:hypothetical protein